MKKLQIITLLVSSLFFASQSYAETPDNGDSLSAAFWMVPALQEDVPATK